MDAEKASTRPCPVRSGAFAPQGPSPGARDIPRIQVGHVSHLPLPWTLHRLPQNAGTGQGGTGGIPGTSRGGPLDALPARGQPPDGADRPRPGIETPDRAGGLEKRN
jgi:hypothetical protein